MFSTAYAAGLGNIAANAGPQVGPFLYAFGALVVIAGVGGMAHVLLQFCDNSKMVRMVDKGTYIGVLGTLIGMGIMVMSSIGEAIMKFVGILFG